MLRRGCSAARLLGCAHATAPRYAASPSARNATIAGDTPASSSRNATIAGDTPTWGSRSPQARETPQSRETRPPRARETPQSRPPRRPPPRETPQSRETRRYASMPGCESRSTPPRCSGNVPVSVTTWRTSPKRSPPNPKSTSCSPPSPGGGRCAGYPTSRTAPACTRGARPPGCCARPGPVPAARRRAAQRARRRLSCDELRAAAYSARSGGRDRARPGVRPARRHRRPHLSGLPHAGTAGARAGQPGADAV